MKNYLKEVKIRQENAEDYQDVFYVIKNAFKSEKFSDHNEQFLVNRLRTSKAFIPELSIVAESEGRIVGHILLTKLKIKNEFNEYDSLALAPVSVQPDYQRKGIGGLLINHAHKIAKELGYKSIVLLGHEKYYPKFGYQIAELYNIKLPFEVPNENCMVIELIENGLSGVYGRVEYPKEFYE